MLRLNNEKKGRLGADWKMNTSKGDQEVKTEYYAGIRMPLKNGDPDLDFCDSNAFRAKPLKLPRRQYGNERNGVKTRGITEGKNPMFIMDRPGGATVTTKNNTLCGVNNDPYYCNPSVVPDYRIAIQEPRDCTNHCNTPQHCINQQKNALLRTRGALIRNPLQVDNGDTIVNYYSNTSSYLKNRVKIESVSPNQCNTICSTNPKATRIFKPNNSRFNVQGAVSSSTRLADLNRRTKSAYNFDQQSRDCTNICSMNNNLNTINTSQRLGGSSAPPYSEKSKRFIPILGQRTLFRRSNGNKTVCCK